MNITYYRNFKTQMQSNNALHWKRNRQTQKNMIDLPAAEPPLISGEEAVNQQDNQKAIGCFYHTEPQALTVTVPGDVTPVRFASHTVLQGLSHDDDSPEFVAGQSGIYEISYTVSAHTINSAYAAFAVQIDGQTVDGSVSAKLVDTQGCMFGASVITELNQGAVIRLIMTSGTAISVETDSNGVSASMMIKKLD